MDQLGGRIKKLRLVGGAVEEMAYCGITKKIGQDVNSAMGLTYQGKENQVNGVDMEGTVAYFMIYPKFYAGKRAAD